MSHYSYFVIGGGSGGIASARRAASHGAKVGIAESSRWGGTCVNVGCVPKKMMWCCSTVRETVAHDAEHYGIKFSSKPAFSWEHMKERRDATIKRLNDIYISNLKSSGVTHFNAIAKFVSTSPERIVLDVGGQEITADHVMIAVGGYPSPLTVPGNEHTINSDGFFALEKQPKKVAVIGAGYIAVELAGVFNGLGTETHMFTRGETALRKFDEMLRLQLNKEMIKQGCVMHPNSQIQSVTKQDGTKTVTTDQGAFEGFDCVLVATGRLPNTDSLNLGPVGVKKDKTGYIEVDEYQRTSGRNIYALGDCCGKAELTPVAIAAGRLLADHIFNNMSLAKLDYSNIPTVIFSHPPIGTIGMSEKEAVEKYGKDKIEVFNSTSVNLYYSAFRMEPSEKPKVVIKLICLLPENKRIVGLHIIGMGADEMLQGFGVAIKMGATKYDFDNCVAIHPTAAEEVVTIAPWSPLLPSSL